MKEFKDWKEFREAVKQADRMIDGDACPKCNATMKVTDNGIFIENRCPLCEFGVRYPKHTLKEQQRAMGIEDEVIEG